MPTFAERVAELEAQRRAEQEVPRPVSTLPLPQDYSTLPVPQGTLRDADTLDRTTGEANRAYGINAPELKNAQGELIPEGQTAYARAAEKFRANPDTKPVRYGEDYYGRTVADEVTPDGRSLYGEMVREGIARPKNYNNAPQIPFAAEARQNYNDNYVPSPEERAMAYAEGRKVSAGIPEPVAFDPKHRTAGETVSSAIERGFESAKAGYFGTLSATGNLLSRTLPEGKDPRSLKDDDPKLTLQDRLTNWMQRTGERGYMEHTAKAAAIPKGASLQDAIKRGTASGWVTFGLEAMGEAIPSIVEMVGIGAATALTGGAAGAGLGGLALRGAAGAGAKAVAERVGERAFVNAARKKLIAQGLAPELAQTQAKTLLADLPAHLARTAQLRNAMAKNFARKGFTTGMFGSSAAMQAGQDYEELKNETGIRAPGASLLAGGLQGALDVAGFEFVLGHFLGKGIPINKARDILKPIMQGALIGIAGEGMTEAAQEVIGVFNTEYHRPSDIPLADRMLSKENLWRYAEAGAAGAIFGGGFSSMGGAAQGAVGYATRERPGTETPAPGTETPATETSTPGTETSSLGSIDPATGQPAGTSAVEVSEPDQELAVNPNIESEPDQELAVNPNIESAPDQELAVNPNIESEPDQELAVNPNIESAPDQELAVNPNIESEPDQELAVNPNIESEPDQELTVNPNIESEPKVNPVDPISPVVEPTGKPDVVSSAPADPTPPPAAKPAAPKWQEPSDDLSRKNGFVFDSLKEAQAVSDTLSAAGMKNLSTTTENGRIAITHSPAPLNTDENPDSDTIRQDVLIAVQKAADYVGSAGQVRALMGKATSKGILVGNDGVTRKVPELLPGPDSYGSLNEAYKVATEDNKLQPGQFAFKQLKDGRYRVADISAFKPVERPTVSPPKVEIPRRAQRAVPAAVAPSTESATTPAGVQLAAAMRKNAPENLRALWEKDAAKAEQATQFIGIGDRDSSTVKYFNEASKLRIANTGKYSADDTVFVSVSGRGRTAVFDESGKLIEDGIYAPIYRNLAKATQAGATILTDKVGTERGQRDSGHNGVGEARLAQYLTNNGYRETNGNGVWKPATSAAPTAEQEALWEQQLRGETPSATTTPAAVTPNTSATAKPFEIVPVGQGEIRGMRGPEGETLATVKPDAYGKPHSGWLGNPYKAVDAGGKLSREDAVAAFKEKFLAKVESDPAFREAVLALRGKKVGYYKPNEEYIHLTVVQDWLAGQPVAPISAAPTATPSAPITEYLSPDELEAQGEVVSSTGETAAPTAAAALSEAATGKTITINGFRGAGKTREAIYGKANVSNGSAVPIAGKGLYIALNEADASNYGEVQPVQVNLKNPLVISSSKEWNALTAAAKAPHLVSTTKEALTDPSGVEAATQRLQAYVQSLGHDGLIIRGVEKDRRLAETFEHDQIIKWQPPTVSNNAAAPTAAVTQSKPASPEAAKEATRPPVTAPAVQERSAAEVKDAADKLGRYVTSLARKYKSDPRQGTYSVIEQKATAEEKELLRVLQAVAYGEDRTGDEINFSKRSGSGHTVESFTQELRKILGKTVANKLLSRPNVTVLATTTDAPFSVAPDTAGLYLPDGRVFFFTENIGTGEAFGKLIHELGAHYGLQRMVGKDTYDAILTRLQELVKAEGFESVKAAHARAVNALGDANHPSVWHETLAYLAEASPKHGLIRRLITAIKRFLLSLGYPAGRLSDTDLVGLIQVAAFKEGKNEGLTGESLSSTRTDPALTVKPFTRALPAPSNTSAGHVQQRWVAVYDDELVGHFATEDRANKALPAPSKKSSGFVQQRWVAFQNNKIIGHFAEKNQATDALPPAPNSSAGLVQQRWGVFYNDDLIDHYATKNQADNALTSASVQEAIRKRQTPPIAPFQADAARKEKNAKAEAARDQRLLENQPGEDKAFERARKEEDRRADQLFEDARKTPPLKSGTPSAPTESIDRLRQAARANQETVAPTAKRVVPEPKLTLPPLDKGWLGKLADQVEKHTPARRIILIARTLSRHPQVQGLLGQVLRIINAGWPVDQRNAALERLYQDQTIQVDFLRALTGFVGRDLPLAQHFGLVDAFITEFMPEPESNLLDALGPPSDAYTAAVRLGLEPKPGENLGVQTENPELHTEVLFVGQYFTDLLAEELLPTINAKKLSEKESIAAFAQREQIRNERLAGVEDTQELTLEDQLMSLRREAALSPGRRASFYLGDAETFALNSNNLAGLTPAGRQLMAYIQKKEAARTKLGEENPEGLKAKDKITSNENRFLKMVRELKASHDAYNRPWGELQVTYNADTQQYAIEEVFFSPINHEGASYTTVTERKTGEVITLQDYVNRFLKNAANRWRKPTDPTDKENIERWEVNNIALVPVNELLTPKQIAAYEALLDSQADELARLTGKSLNVRSEKLARVEIARNRDEVVIPEKSKRIFIRASMLTQLGWQLSKAHNMEFDNAYDVFQYAQQVLLEETGLVVENRHNELDRKNISGKKDVLVTYAAARSKSAEIKSKQFAGVDEDAELSTNPQYGPAWNPTSDTLRKAYSALKDGFTTWREKGLSNRGALYKALDATKPTLTVEDFRAIKGIMGHQLTELINEHRDPTTHAVDDAAVAKEMIEFFDDFYEDRLEKLSDRKERAYNDDLAHQYDTALNDITDPHERQAALNQEQSRADKERQKRVVSFDVLGETSTAVTGEENLPPPPSGVSEAGNPKTPSAAHKLVSAVVEALGLQALNIKLFSSKDLEAYEAALKQKSPMTWLDFANKKVSGLPPASVAFIDGQVLIYYDAALNKAPEQLAEALSHELGHVVFRSLLNQERERNTEVWQQLLRDYVTSGSQERFMEWFADETAKWARAHGKSVTGRDSFMTKVVTAIKALMEALGFTAGKGAVSAYLDGLARREQAKGVALTLAELGGKATSADMLTFQLSALSRATPLLRPGVSRIDFLTLDGIKRGTITQYQRALNAVPMLARLDHNVRSTYKFAEDALSSMNAWLREQDLPELNLLADKLDNQARAARTVKLLSNDEIYAALHNDPRFKDDLAKAPNSRFMTDLLARADALRKMDGVEGVQIVTWVHSATGERRAEAVPVHRASFNETVRRLYDGQWGAGPEGFRRLIHKKTEAEARQWGEELLRNDPQSEGAKAIRDWLDTFYNEYIVPGYTGPHSKAEGKPVVHIGRLEDWGLARYYNKDAVERNYDAFIKILTTDYHNADGSLRWKKMSFPDASVLAAGIVTGREAVPQTATEELLINPTFSPGAESKKTREIDIPIDQLLPFLETRVDKIMESYVHSMIKRVEWDKRFGEEVQYVDNEGNARWTWQQNYHLDNIKQGILYNNPAVKTQRLKYILDKTNKVIEAYLGRYGAFVDPRARQLISWTQVATNYLVMPLSLLSQAPDMIGPLTRMGGNSKAYFKGFREAAREIFKQNGDVWRTAEMMGVIYRDTKNLGASALYDQQFLTEGAQKANDFLFKINGMQLFTNFSRLVSFQASKYWLESLVEHKDGARLLKQVGLTQQDVIDWVQSGYKDYQTSDTENSVPFKVMLARVRFVNESVFSPHAGQRPLVANHPYMALIWHLKQFAYSFFVQLLKPALREVRDNPALFGKMMAVLPLALMFPMAMLGMGLRDEIKQGLGRDGDRLSFDKDADGFLSEFGKVLSRTGVLGPIQLLLDADRASSWGRSFSFSLLGASASKVEELFLADGGLDAAMRLVPGLAMLPAERMAIRNWWQE